MWLSRWGAVAFIPLSPAARSRSARGENAVEVPPRLLRPPRADSGLINRDRLGKISACRREEDVVTTRFGSPRAEFGRTYLQSLIAFSEERVATHRAEGHRLRSRLAVRRLHKLRAYEAQRGLPPGAVRERAGLPVFEWLQASGRDARGGADRTG
jgi:hypothetical protein